MAQAIDIQLDKNNEIIIRGCDFAVGYSDQQHAQLLIDTNIGSWKEFPLVGVGIKKYINSSGAQAQIKRDIQVQIINDGYQINDLVIKDFDQIYLSAERIQTGIKKVI